MEKCPSCERKFDSIKDYPLVLVESVSIIKLGQVPDKIPDWYEEQLLEKETKGWNRKIIPSDVLAYCTHVFKGDEFIYGEDIYIRPKDNESSNMPRMWGKKHNHSLTIKKLLRDDQSVEQYFNSLEKVVGKEVPTSSILPSWEKDKYLKVYQIPGNKGLLFNLYESEKKEDNPRIAELVVLGEGPNLGSGGGPTLSYLIQIGQIKYQGRVKNP